MQMWDIWIGGSLFHLILIPPARVGESCHHPPLLERKVKLETFDLLLWALGLIVLPEGEMVNFPGNVSCGTVAEMRALA